MSDRWNQYWGVYRGINIMLADDGSIYGGYGASSNKNNYAKTETDQFNLDQWYHLCVVFEEYHNVRIYLNGALLSTTETHPELSSIYSGSLNDKIGGSGDGQNRFFYYGSIDDLKIFNRLLTEQEIKDLYQEGGWTGK